MDQRAPSSVPTAPKPARRRVRHPKRWTISRLRGRWRTIGIGAAALVVVVGLIWWITPRGAGHKPQEQPKPVGVAKVTTGDVPVHLNALGTVTPLATVIVRAQVSGELSVINFTEGQTVAAGDKLAQIDPRPYQAALDQAKGQLARDQAQLANARVDLGRYKTLVEQKSISGQQYDTQAALVRQDEGIVTSDQAGVESAAINLNYTSIVSPVTGRVGLRQVDLGNLVQASNTIIVVVTQLQPISVLFPVSEDSIGQISGRLKDGATLEAVAFDRAHSRQIATGQLATLDNQIDVTTGTVKLRGLFDNTDNALFPNQFVNIQLLVDTAHNQIIVPTAAIQRGASGTYVFVVNSDNTVKMTNVTLGQADGEQQAVTKGLQADQTVVTDGADGLRDGAHVQLPDANGQQPQEGQGNQPKQQSGRQGGKRDQSGHG